MEGIQVSTELVGSRNQIAVIKVGGYIDTTTSSEVERSLNSLLKQGKYHIIIDLGNVDYISSAGWGIFISEIKAIRENNGDLKLVRMIPDVYEIFELLEFHHILDVYDSVPEAVGKFEESQFVEVVAEPAAPASPAQSAFGRPAAGPPRPAPGQPPQPQRPASNFQPQQPQQPPAEPASKPDLVSMSVEDKIKLIIAQNPDLSAFKINKRLNSTEFGFTKVGWFGVRAWLNRMGMKTRKSRRKFADYYRNMYN